MVGRVRFELTNTLNRAQPARGLPSDSNTDSVEQIPSGHAEGRGNAMQGAHRDTVQSGCAMMTMRRVKTCEWASAICHQYCAAVVGGVVTGSVMLGGAAS